MFFCAPDPGSGGVCHEAADMPGEWLMADWDFSRLDLMTISGSSVTRLRMRSPNRANAVYEMVSSGSIAPNACTWLSSSNFEAIQFPGPVFTGPANCYFQNTRSLARDATEFNDGASGGGTSDRPVTNVWVVWQGMVGASSDAGEFFGMANGGTDYTYAIGNNNSWFGANIEQSSLGYNPNFSRGTDGINKIVIESQTSNGASSDKTFITKHISTGIDSGGTNSNMGLPRMNINAITLLGCRYWKASARPDLQGMGKIRRVIIFKKTPTLAERRRIGQYLRTKYGCI